jgi:hypothetical protein
MNTAMNKTQENTSKAVANDVAQKQSGNNFWTVFYEFQIRHTS